MVASAGASLRELMDRMGHSSPRAALIYQHSTDERQRALAEAVARQAQAALDAGTRGTYGARPAQAAGA
jgi:chemotaxis response regulator CheB